MPNTIIGIDKWMKDNRKDVESMLSGIFAGGDAIKSSDAALQIVAVEDFRSKINQRFSEYEVKAQQAIAEYEKKIAETKLSIESAKSRSADVMSACDIEIDKLDDVTEFFTLDTGSSKHGAPAAEPEKVGV